MSSVSLAPLASTIVNELPCLIERTLKYNVENNILENQVFLLKSQIDTAKKNIATERAVQRGLRDKIKATRGNCTDNSSTLSLINGASLGNAGVPSIHEQPDRSMASQSSVTSTSLLFSDSPVSLRTKRKGIVFSDDVRIVKKLKMGSGRGASSVKENNSPNVSYS